MNYFLNHLSIKPLFCSHTKNTLWIRISFCHLAGHIIVNMHYSARCLWCILFFRLTIFRCVCDWQLSLDRYGGRLQDQKGYSCLNPSLPRNLKDHPPTRPKLLIQSTHRRRFPAVGEACRAVIPADPQMPWTLGQNFSLDSWTLVVSGCQATWVSMWPFFSTPACNVCTSVGR